MLMSEQDYADIGLPKEPRVKLLNSMRQFRPNNQAQSPPHYQHQQQTTLKHINPQPSWNSSIDDTRLPPGLRNSVPYSPTPQLSVRKVFCILIGEFILVDGFSLWNLFFFS